MVETIIEQANQAPTFLEGLGGFVGIVIFIVTIFVGVIGAGMGMEKNGISTIKDEFTYECNPNITKFANGIVYVILKWSVFWAIAFYFVAVPIKKVFSWIFIAKESDGCAGDQNETE